MAKKSGLKKNLFWILSGVAPALTLIAVVVLWLSVGSAIEARTKLIEDQQAKLKSTQGTGTKVLSEFDTQIVTLTNKKDELWKANWERQADQYKLFAWPQDTDPRNRLKRIEDQHAKFGQPIVDPENALEVFKRADVYEAAYDRAAQTVRPTRFRGDNWRNVFRHVNPWGVKQPTSTQIWLALEDLWVQRGLIEPITAVNRDAATFTPVPPAPGASADPFDRLFRTKVWELHLWIDKGGTDNILKAELKNRTDRLQLLGVGKTMRLKVWLSDLPTARPIDFRIEGQFVPAGETLKPKPEPRLHTIPAGVDKQKIARVELILDTLTVPVRRIEEVGLGGDYQVMDARDYATIKPANLKKPSFVADAPATPVVDEFGNTIDPDMGGGLPPGVPGPGGLPPGADGVGTAKAGPPETILNFNEKRYVDLTAQVRRMPFRVVVLVDQMFVQETLVAYANSPLRCQITQCNWERFRGVLPPPQVIDDGSGLPAGSGSSDPDTFVLPLTGAGGSFPGDPEGIGEYGSGGTDTEGQASSGLVQLQIYGIVSLYEKYEQKKAETPPADGTTP